MDFKGDGRAGKWTAEQVAPRKSCLECVYADMKKLDFKRKMVHDRTV